MVHVPDGAFMRQFRRNGVPAYQRIQTAILKRLESGLLKPGDTVNSERELAKIHRVSLMTARHALAGLEREGMVVRRRGAGTFVAPPKIHFNKLMSYTEQMSSRSLAASSKLLSLGTIDTEPEIAARLALPANGRLIKLERLRLGANEPFAIETCYLSAEDFAGLTQSPLDRVSLFSILEHDYGLEIAHADEEIDATIADPHTARLLGIPHGAPVLRIRQLIYSTKGKTALYVLGLYRSDRHTLLIRRFR
jgi:GntR family transcriptional regulator